VTLTSHDQLRQWLVAALGDMGGRATRQQALRRIQGDFGDLLTQEDRHSPPTRPFEETWKNRVSFERQHMVDEGLLAPYVERGDPWALTSAGWSAYRDLVGEDSVDVLANFKPKDSRAYRAHVEGRLLLKARSHEALIADFGLWVASRGFTPVTTVHPRDLVLRSDDQEWLVEAKVVYEGNATNAVRESVGQLLSYAYFLYGARRPMLLALFSESIGDAYVDFLESLHVQAIWRTASGWGGSASAVTSGLV
jgi:hypothetical protein